MTTPVTPAFAPGRVTGDSLTLTELMALPAVTDLITAGKALGMGRTKSYELARAGTFPCRVIRAGKTYRVPTAALLALLGISPPALNSPAATTVASRHTGDPPATTAGRTTDTDRASRRHEEQAAHRGAAVAPGPDGQQPGVAEWLERWLARARLRDSTRRSYQGHLRNHLRARLSGMPLSALDVAALERLFTAMLEDGVSEATVRRVYCTLRSALNAAVRERLIGDNPARYLQVPAGRRPHAVIWTRRRVKDWRRTGKRPAVAVWTPAQTRRFLRSAAGHPMYAAFLLTTLRGLRRGEACGLRWSDLDLDAGLAYISRQVQRVNGFLTTCPLKTAASCRAVALDPQTMTTLHALRQAQHEYARAHGIAPSRYVVPGTGGGPLRPEYLTITFRRLVAAAGLPPVRLHDLRHGAATLMLLEGADLKTIADQLGHSSVVLTADTYLSVAAELGLSAAANTARLILSHGGRPPGGGNTRRRSAPAEAIVTVRATPLSAPGASPA
jgi:integrase